MDWFAFLQENKKITGLIFTLFIILVAVVSSTMQKQVGFVI